jgi:hypothetical protein
MNPLDQVSHIQTFIPLRNGNELDIVIMKTEGWSLNGFDILFELTNEPDMVDEVQDQDKYQDQNQDPDLQFVGVKVDDDKNPIMLVSNALKA